MSPLLSLLLLAGLVGFPALLLAIGHGLRRRSRRVRGAFWGGVAGYLLADAAFLGLLLAPPLAWPPGPGAWTVPAVLLVPPGAGLLVGALVGREPVRRRR